MAFKVEKSSPAISFVYLQADAAAFLRDDFSNITGSYTIFFVRSISVVVSVRLQNIREFVLSYPLNTGSTCYFPLTFY